MVKQCLLACYNSNESQRQGKVVPHRRSIRFFSIDWLEVCMVVGCNELPSESLLTISIFLAL